MNLVILASGESKRFGKDKLAMYLKDKKIYQYTKDLYSDIKELDTKVIVSSRLYLKDEFERIGFLFIKNNFPEYGISYSIRLAMKELIKRKKSEDATMFATADQPLLSRKSILSLIQYYYKNNKGIVSLAYRDKMANPKIFSAKYNKELLNINGDIGGRQIIKKNISDFSYLNIDNYLEVFDIDTKDDYSFINSIL